MNVSKDFADFISLLDKYKVEYMIVGGYAVGLHGWPRYTGDLDIWINKAYENISKLKKVILDFGGPAADIDFDKLRLKPTKANPVPGIGFGREPIRIEILGDLAGIDFKKCFLKAEVKKIGDIKIKYIHYDDLKMVKLKSGRPQDKLDIINLDRLRKKKK